MVRESGTPVFPIYLLPSFSFGFPRRHSASSSASSSSASSASSSPSSSASSAMTSPGHCPPDRESAAIKSSGGAAATATRRLSRTAADTLRCSSCSTDIALASQIISKGFTGRYGRAYLVAPPPASPSPSSSLLNVRVGKSENRQLVTGWHVVADISCGICSRKLGWKYVDAREQSQKYKVGKFILETERVVTHRSWNDVPAPEDADLFEEGGDDRREGDEDEIVFDSDDEDECDDVFAGVWDAETVAKRRSRRALAKATWRAE